MLLPEAENKIYAALIVIEREEQEKSRLMVNLAEKVKKFSSKA